MNKLKKLYHDVQEVIAWISLFFLLFVLVMAIGLTCMRAAKAEELYSFPVAIVQVDAGSTLNVRRTPAGDWAYYGLPSGAEVMILEEEACWAYVTSIEMHEAGMIPYGWVSSEYLLRYNVHLTARKNPWLAPRAGMYPHQIGQVNYTTTGGANQ